MSDTCARCAYAVTPIRIEESDGGLANVDAITSRLARSAAGELSVHVGDTWIAPYGYVALEGLRVRALAKDVKLVLHEPVDERPRFSRVIGFGGAGSGSPTTIPIQRFERGASLGGVDRFLNDRWAKLAIGLEADVVQHAISAIGEIYQNAMAHARSDVGVLTCGQYFRKRDELHLTVLDLGIGIPGSIAEGFERDEADIDHALAVEWSFGEGNSSTRASRGLGLAIFREFLRKAGATMFVYSGFGSANLQADRWTVRTLPFRFPGTLIDVALPVDRLASLETE